LIELGKVNRRCREVPHELTQELMRRRIDICEKLLRHPKDERFLKQIVSCDENGFIIVTPTQAINGLIKVAKLKQLSNMVDMKKESFMCMVEL